MNFEGWSDDETKRWLWLRAVEWAALPAFASQPLVPILLIFFPWYWVLGTVVTLGLLWCPIRYLFVNVAVATAVSLFVAWLKWPAAIGSGIYLFLHHHPVSAVIALLWPLLGAFVGIPGKVGLIELAFAEKIDPTTKEVSVPQGWQVFISGIVGLAFGIGPAIFYAPPWGLLISGKVYHFFGFAPGVFHIPAVRIITLFFWACIVGMLFTYWWSKALHDRVKLLRFRLICVNALTVEEQQAQEAERILWMPAWIGIFERGFYCLLIGHNIAGGAAFIGAWIALKTAGGWQIWSKGTTYGRAVLFAGLLGNALSVLFGVVPGLVMSW